MKNWHNITGQGLLLIGTILVQACLKGNPEADPGASNTKTPDNQLKKPDKPVSKPPTLEELMQQTADLIQARSAKGEKVNELTSKLTNALKHLQNGNLGINDKFDATGKKLGAGDNSSWSTLLTFVSSCPQVSQPLRLQYLRYAKAQGGDFKVFGEYGRSLPHLLVTYRDPDALKWVLEHTAAKGLITALSTGSGKETPLELAVSLAVSSEQYDPEQLAEHLKVVEVLLQQAPNQTIDAEQKIRNAESKVGAAKQTRALLQKYGKL